MNLVFHIVATLGLVALLYWVLKLQKELKFLRSMVECSCDEKSRVYLDTPANFLSKFAEVFDIELMGEISKTQTMIKVDPRSLTNLHCNSGIKSIQLSHIHDEQIAEISLHNMNIANDIESKLSITLAHKVTFKIRGKL